MASVSLTSKFNNGTILDNKQMFRTIDLPIYLPAKQELIYGIHRMHNSE